MAGVAPLTVGAPGVLDPAVAASRVNFHYLRTCVILENQDKSSVIIWTAPDSPDGQEPELQFRRFTGPPTERMPELFLVQSLTLNHRGYQP